MLHCKCVLVPGRCCRCGDQQTPRTGCFCACHRDYYLHEPIEWARPVATGLGLQLGWNLGFRGPRAEYRLN